jgi:hypothetical protein
LGEVRDAPTPRESAQRLLTLVAALSEHDRLTRGHSERVRAYSVMIGEELKLSREELDLLNWAALLHDVGKLEVAGEILRKPGRPTDTEWQQIRRHPVLGEQLVAPMRPWLGSWGDAVGYHHERWDGNGYPRGTAGEEIPLAGRIVAVADVFDVLTSARSYKEPGSAVAGRSEIARCAGAQFDPRLVRAFLNVSLGRMRLVMGPLSWLAHTPVLGRVPLAPAASTVWSAVAVVVAATGLAGSVKTPSEPASKPALAAVGARQPAPAGGARVTTRELPRGARPPLEGAGGQPAGPAPAENVGAPAPAGSGDPSPDSPGGDDPTPPDDSRREPPDRRPPNDSLKEPPVPPVSGMTVNDAPSFTAGADQLVLEDAGGQAVAGWARAIRAGPASEIGQTVSFVVENDNPALFAAQPRVSPLGVLEYTPAADASGAATVTVRAMDNGGTADGGKDTSKPHTLTIGVVAVNDRPSFVNGPNQSLLEGAGAQTVANWATDVSSGPASESGQTVSFDVTNDNPTLFAAQPQVQPDGTLGYTPAAEASGSATVTVRAVDDGGSALGGTDASAPQTFTITVAAVNDAPSFSGGADQLVLVDSGPQSVPAWATGISPGPANEAAQSVTFDVTNDNPGLFSAQPQIGPSGTLTYTSAPAAQGLATVTVRALDDGGTALGGDDASAPQAFTITVTEVNDPPSFAAGADQSVLEDSGPQTVGGWATGISPGPASEASQSVSFNVAASNPSLFSAQPQVQPNGTLTYTPAANVSGSATVSVAAVDDGGTAFGGTDTSAPQTFVITVAEVNDAPSFTGGSDQIVLLNSSQQVIPGWATNISAGESGQSVTFNVSTSSPGLFSVQPQVQPNGTLTYTPAFLALGAATVTVTAVDNGGTANGGTDTSAPQAFTITIIL